MSIIGPYKTGKSSFISYLTGDAAIETGDGCDAQKNGVWLYGPYSLNFLKLRWQVPDDPGGQTQVIFVDTESFQLNNFGDHTFLMGQTIAPYLAIAHVSILIHPKHMEKGSIDTLQIWLNEFAQESIQVILEGKI